MLIRKNVASIIVCSLFYLRKITGGKVYKRFEREWEEAAAIKKPVEVGLCIVHFLLAGVGELG